MRNILIGIVAFVALDGTAAIAADIPLKAPATTDAYSWTGFYLGANAGGAWSSADVTSTINPVLNPPADAILDAADSPSLRGSGFTGGGQLGFNYQSGFAVWGIEADFDYFRTSGSQTVTSEFPGGGGVSITTVNSFGTNWLATVRPRLGIAFDRTLIYATGGLAVADLSYNTLFTSSASNFEGAAFSKTRAGWTVGGGLEAALAGNWTAKVEYLYMDFGSADVTAPTFFVGFPDGLAITHSVHLTNNLVRAGINYRLGGSGY